MIPRAYRRFSQLKKEEKEKAVVVAVENLVQSVVEGSIRFSDELNQDDLQARIDGAIERANANQTPWFAGECIMEVAGDDVRGMARCDAEDAIYPAPTTLVIRLPA